MVANTTRGFALLQSMQRFLSAQMSLDDMSSYDRLYTTCTSSLPTEPLLRALALCSSSSRPVLRRRLRDAWQLRGWELPVRGGVFGSNM